MKFPRPHWPQYRFLTSSAKRRVVVAGRRGGKTTGAAIAAGNAAFRGRRVLEAAPTADQTLAFWDAVTSYFEGPIAAGLVRKNESYRLLELWNGGRIRCKTAWNADTLRGDHADLLILDEYADMDPDAWDLVGAPMLLDNDGDAVFIGTPKRRNHFHRLYERARTDDTGRWQAWHFVSMDNPYLSRAALDEITEDMSASAYQQEILAEFLEGEGQVFRNIRANLTTESTTPADHRGHALTLGADWGQVQDRTAFSIICRDCKREVLLTYSREQDYALQRQRLEGLYRDWGVRLVVPEANAMGTPIIEQLERSGIRVAPFMTTAASKPPLIESLVLALERGEVQWIDDPVGTAELESYEMKINPNTNRPTYSAPSGMHDDTVIARALALFGLLQARPFEGV